MQGANRTRSPGHLFASARAVGWQRPAVSDAIAIAIVAAGVFAVSVATDAFGLLYDWSKSHEGWEVDELLTLPPVLTVALMIYGYRRLQDLKREVAARRAAEDAAQTLARHDPLTGLPNRRYFSDKLDEALRAAFDEGHRVAVLILDLDGFKAINDMHGHSVGDNTLAEFAERISILAKDTLVARTGGDEFAIVLSELGSLDQAATLARRISAAVAEPFAVAGAETTLGVDIGIAIAPDDGATTDDLVRRAELALNRAQAEGCSSTRFFEPAMDAYVERRTTVERELRAAIAANAIEVHYQPLVNLVGSRIIGFEALARWNNPQLGTVFPSVFIAVAEESGLIHQLGDQLLRIACREAKTWPVDFTLAFNISPLQLRNSSFGLRVLSILADTGLAPTRLELEITESALAGDGPTAQRLIDELREAGVRIALDDFGTGYATMSQLLAFRLDRIKIDRSFVSGLGRDASNKVIVKAIIGLAQGLGLSTTAEGIETAAQLADIKAVGCIEGQGYYFGKAMPSAQIADLLAHPSIVDAVA